MFLVYTGNITSVFLDYFIFAYICALENLVLYREMIYGDNTSVNFYRKIKS